MPKKKHVENDGTAIKIEKNRLVVPNDPIIPFIEVTAQVLTSGMHLFVYLMLLYVRHIRTKSVFIGRKFFAGKYAFDEYGEWLPKNTLDAIKKYKVAIKGPLTTPVGGGIRSLNVTLRQELDLYACVRPVRYFDGVPSPVKFQKN